MKYELTIADWLTLLRLLLVPVFLVSFVMGAQEIALISFSVAGFTDLIDGSVARFLKKQTRFGATLDPIADKFLLESCFIALTIVGILPLWFLLLAFVRDVMILSGIYYLNRIKAQYKVRALLVSKVATLVQLTLAVLGILMWWKPHLISSLATPFAGLVFVAAFLILISGMWYVRVGIGILKTHSRSSS